MAAASRSIGFPDATKSRNCARPPEYRGWKTPDILLSGSHANIERWRREQALERTRQRRPDLLPPDVSSTQSNI